MPGQPSAKHQRSEPPVNTYLAEALDLTATEQSRLDRVLDALPARVADAHTHIARAEHLGRLTHDIWTHAVSTFPAYSLQMAKMVRSVLWRDTAVWSLRMPHAVGGYYHRQINDYLLEKAGTTGDVVGGFGLPDDIDYTISMLASGVSALKMYYRYHEPSAKSLAEVFPDDVLCAAAELAVPIIVHLPQSLPDSRPDLDELAKRHPSLQIVIAHAGGGGGQMYRDDVVPAFEALAAMPNVYFDTALVWDRPLLRALIAAVGPERVLFGTDEPLSLIRAVPYQHSELGPRLYAPRYHWALNDHAPRHVAESRKELLHLLQVESVLAAVAPYGVDAVQSVFHDNAVQLCRERTVRSE